MLLLKILIIYLGVQFVFTSLLMSVFNSNETKDEIKNKPLFPAKFFRILFIIGVVLIITGLKSLLL